MVFSSLSFLFLFLPIVKFFDYISKEINTKNTILLILSLIFYSWGEPRYVFLMIISIIINYFFGILIAKHFNCKIKILTIGLIFNILLLVYFKYIMFIVSTTNVIFNLFNINTLKIATISLPIGISFYTFQSISYLIDVYRQPEIAEKNIVNLGLYISLFPQLIAGPILRFSDISDQLKSRITTEKLITSGLTRFIIGLSKKILIANNVGALSDMILTSSPINISTYHAWIGIISYSIQIYFDFSGYSDMAIGLGSIFGFKIPENFNYPYMATSITDFWRRWHISLSSWFKDYMYIPLGGNRLGPKRTYLNLFIVFLTTGLWHGAGLNFIAWGLGHGMLLIFEKIYLPKINQNRYNGILRIYTLFSVVTLWSLFRIGHKSFLFLFRLFGINPTTIIGPFQEINPSISFDLMLDSYFYLSLLAGIIFSIQWNFTFIKKFNKYLKYIFLLILLLLSIINISDNQYNPFIYFRF